MAKILNPRGDGRDADVMDHACVGRPCLWIGENKGTYTQGRGYTRYYKKPRLVCWTRHQNGCPHPLPEFNPETTRCCPAPTFPRPRKGTRPQRQRCQTCGQWATRGIVLESRRSLPTLEHVKCKHEALHHDDGLFPDGMWRCRGCSLYWLHKPKPFECGETFKELLDRKFPSENKPLQKNDTDP